MKRRSSIAFGFLMLIAVGAVLLASPFARAAGTWGSFADALFTACSAVCVTGLTVVDVGAEFSRNGLVILLALVEIGCLGLMTCATFLMIAIGRRLSLHSEFSLMNAYGVPAVRGLKGLICWVIGSVFVFQAAGAAILSARGEDLFTSIFYSVMNFCNAGFSIRPGSLAFWSDKPCELLTMAALTVLGGIGFLVLFNLFTFKFMSLGSSTRGQLSLHTKTVLRMTVFLLTVTFAAFLAIEWNHSLAGLPFVRRLTVGTFQAVTPRTCGFVVIPTEDLQPLTRLLYEVMMFFGGAPGSAAGGLKVTTLAVLVYTLTAMCRGESETVISMRTVPLDIVRESIVIVMALLALVVLAFGALLVTEDASGISSDALFFETVSAVTTTGLTVGDTTSRLSSLGRAVIMVAMFCGRLGALTVVMLIGDRETNRRVRYPNEELVVG